MNSPLLLLVPLLAIAPAAAAEDALRSVFDAAARELTAGQLSQAEHGFRQVLAANPKHVGALGNLGVVYMRMDRPADAVPVYRRALEIAPADPLLHRNIALAYLKQDDYSAAKSHLAKVVAARPADTQARQLLATTQLFTGETEAGVKALESLRGGGDNSVLYFLAIGYLKQGKREQGKQVMNELFAALSPAKANFLAGRAYYESTLFDDAIAALEKARELDPRLPGIHRELGKAYVSVRRSEDARRSLEAALAENPSDPEAQYFLGAQLVQERQAAAAIPLLDTARAARPAFWGAYYYLAKAHFENGNTAAALPLLERAAELNPSESSVFYLLARAMRKAGRTEDARRASARFEQLEAERRKSEQQGLSNR